jgi:hypothetical protein
MPGTEHPPNPNASQPPNVSIREHIEALMAAADLRYAQRFESQQEATKQAFITQTTAMQTAFDASKVAIDQALASAKEAVAAALAAADRAVSKSEMAADKRFESVNEFRSTLSDQQRLLMPRSEAELMLKTLSDKLEVLRVELASLGAVKRDSSYERTESRADHSHLAVVGSVIVAVTSLAFTLASAVLGRHP